MKVKNVFIVALCCLVSISANAGLVQPAEVEIDFENQFAAGDMVTARASKNKQVLIGCGSRRIGGFAFGFCQARVAEGEEGNIICTTQDEYLLDAITAISDYSYVTFSWDENNECTRIGTSTQSFYLPKIKANKTKD